MAWKERLAKMAYLDLRDLATELGNLKEYEEQQSLDEEERTRLADLRKLEGQLFTDTLAEYAENEPTMIPELDFEEYAEEFAYDVGFAKRPDDNPLHSFIDWEAWANSLKADYSEVEFGGETYLIRAY